MTGLNLEGTRQVELHNVDKELRAMWGAAAGAESVEPAAPVIRAFALNLVVYVADRTRLADILGVIDRVSASNPNRAIVLLTDADVDGTDLTTNIRSVCHTSDKGGKKLCCEQVVVVGGPGTDSVIHSVLPPLLVPDLPVFLWWNHRPDLAGNVFQRLCKVVDRVIVNSDPYNRQDFDRFADFVVHGSEEAAISDLNWGRLTRWREILAQFYDSSQYRVHLGRLNGIELEYASTGMFPVRPLLLVGWLARCLGLAPLEKMRQSDNCYRARLRSATDEISVTMTVTAAAGSDSVISNIRLATADDAAFAASRVPRGDFAETMVTLPGAESERRIAKMNANTVEQLLRQELEMLDRDTLYEESLRMASQLA